ncbi:MAG: GTP cyclohydrolase FolE2 [Verrucomicrobiota bacterium]|jgi:GTP cyclohydrolase I|nr:GTP cyclohydrolase FolE2 [Verrucomicrobiota bacterium]
MEDLIDTQSESDERGIKIDWVGISSYWHPIQIHDKSGSKQNTVAEFSLAVNLPQECRGTHMSRFVEVLNESPISLSVNELHSIPQQLLGRLSAKHSKVSIKFPYFIEKLSPQSGATGMMNYEVNFETVANQDEVDSKIVLKIPVTTVCPCSKAISERGAHNQRGVVTYSVRFNASLWIEDLICLVESCASSQLYSLLKRSDEKRVTEEAYDNPVFVEDLVRNIAVKSNDFPNISWYRIEAENFESIHNHNAYAVIEKG